MLRSGGLGQNWGFDSMNKSEVILELGAEGGSLTLFGTRSEHSWVYRTYTIDQTPTLVDEQ